MKLRINASEMAALPWEFLYDANEAEYVCLSSNTPIVRYIELPRPPQPLAVTPPLRILGMTASPRGLVGLDVEREKQRVEIALKDLQTKGAIELTWLEGQTAYDLQRAMRGGPWHIFHFIGHGGFNASTDEGLIALMDENGRAADLSATRLGRLLADHRSLRLVVLNSCEGAKGSTRDIFSSTAAILVRRGIPAVLAMQYEITDRAAITLSKVFYEALAEGTPVDMAVSEARKTMSLAAGFTVEWGTPVLYMRSPNGVLFDVREQPSLPHEPPDLSADVSTPSERRFTTPSVPKPQSFIESPSPAKPLPSLKPEVVSLPSTLTGDKGGVQDVAFSPDAQTLASNSDNKTIKLFYCYARADKPLRDELEKCLAWLRRRYQLTTWHDREILPGEAWEQAIDPHLNTAHLILLLISPDFMASEYCYGKEMQRALEHHRAGTCRVVPILLRPTYWEGAPFSHLQLLPTDARAITSWPDRDEAFQDVARGIDRTIKDLLISLKTKEEWLTEGNALNDFKRPQEALTAFERAIQLDPNSAVAYNNKGNALYDLKRYEEALAAYERAIQLDPNYTSAYHNKGHALYYLKRYQEALTAYEQAIRLDPNFVQANYNKGLALVALGKNKEAQQTNERARQLDYSS